MLGHDQFFHADQFGTADELIALAYDLAHFWRTDPEVMTGRTIDVLFESYEHAYRIVQEKRVE
ncbi:hypothetical protein EJJ20_34865 [Pseudomonas poae]|nr:hypothetical protein EJJ20_34865 [Pseudomonas poae]